MAATLPLWVAAQVLSVQPEGSGGQDLTPYWSHLQDDEASMSLDQVLQAAPLGPGSPWREPTHSGMALALGFTDAAHWLRLTVRNPSPQPSQQMLEVANARLAHVTLFAPDATGRYQATQTGGDLPFATRPFANRQFVFPLTLAAQSEQVLYLRVQTNIGFVVPAQLWPVADFAVHVRNDYILQMGYFGLAAGMVLFNLMLFIALRDRVYLLYVCFTLCSVLILAGKSGVWDEFLWPHSVALTNVPYYSAVSLAFAVFFQFMRLMLQTPRLMQRSDKALRTLSVLHGLAPLAYAYNLAAAAPYAIAFCVFSALLATAVGVLGMYRKRRIAYFFMGAFAMLSVGVLMVLLRGAGWLPTNAFTVNGMLLGSALEMLLLAFALADRFNQMRRDKLQVQRELVATQQTLLDSLQRSERELAQRVDERTEQLQAVNLQLAALSMVDGLTGIANRRLFDQELQKAWARLERQGQPLALVMLDVDMFKRYNDHYGHQAGDECLRQVAQAIASVGRNTDVVARYGGEEFVMVAPVSDGPSALLLAQRACQAVQALGVEHLQSPFGVVTLSCGVASMVPSGGAMPQDLLRHADTALYQAKAQGRNQAVLASP